MRGCVSAPAAAYKVGASRRVSLQLTLLSPYMVLLFLHPPSLRPTFAQCICLPHSVCFTFLHLTPALFSLQVIKPRPEVGGMPHFSSPCLHSHFYLLHAPCHHLLSHTTGFAECSQMLALSVKDPVQGHLTGKWHSGFI